MESWKLKMKGDWNQTKGKINRPMVILPMMI